MPRIALKEWQKYLWQLVRHEHKVMQGSEQLIKIDGSTIFLSDNLLHIWQDHFAHLLDTLYAKWFKQQIYFGQIVKIKANTVELTSFFGHLLCGRLDEETLQQLFKEHGDADEHQLSVLLVADL